MNKSDIKIIEKEIDEYIAEIRKELFMGWANGVDTVDFVEVLLRATYAKGMADALRHPEHFKEWITSHGYKVPTPIQAQRESQH